MATENMVKAGKGGLTFASDWDSTIEYDRLTGVRYDNKLFFSKKPVPIGLIPEDGEYWFLAYEGLTDEQWEALLNGTQQVGDSAKLGGKDAELYALLTDLANYLPLSGGTVRNSKAAPLGIESQYSTMNISLLQYINKGTTLGYLGFSDANIPVFYNDGGNLGGALLHTGNKPTGTYTGNGDSAPREITTGGIGRVYLVSSVNGMALLRLGAIMTDGSNVTTVGSAQAKGDYGVITLRTVSPLLNQEGTLYTYHEL